MIQRPDDSVVATASQVDTRAGAYNTGVFGAIDGTWRVRSIDTNNLTIDGLANTTDTAASTDGTGPAARFNDPTGLVVDMTGNVYVADTSNSAIRKITATGATTTVAGTAGKAGIVLGTTPGLAFPRTLALVDDSIVISDSSAILLLRHGAR